MPQVSNDEFLAQLSLLFKDAKAEGSVHLGQKRLAKDGPDSVLHAKQAPYALVFRASNGRSTRGKSSGKHASRSHCSTIVNPENLGEFWRRYSESIKKGAAGLRKKEKKKAKKN